MSNIFSPRILDAAIAIWKSREQAGHYWCPDRGTFPPPPHLEFVPCGNARLTRKVKAFAEFVVFERDDWGTKTIGYLADSGKVAGAKSTIAVTPSARQVRRSQFERRYVSWKDALPQACEALFNLNRYAKHATCSSKHRERIYSLKNQMIRLLYENGYCVACWLHLVELESKVCWSCNGTGRRQHRCRWGEGDFNDELYEFDDEEDDYCHRCDGSGCYEPTRTLTFVCFRFEVQGQSYVWHQPADRVRFEFLPAGAPEAWQPDQSEKPVLLKQHAFAAAKELIAWVIDHARSQHTDSEQQS